jgi:hypothetical protein
MALEEIKKVDNIEVVENGVIQVRTATIIERDGVEISRTFHRHTVSPGDDLNNQDVKVKSIASSIWTEEVILSYKSSINKYK